MSPAVAEIGEKVADVLRERGVLKASIFGSFARGEEAGESDVDFLVEVEEGRTLLDLSALRLDLSDALDREVDVVTPKALHPRMRDQILRERVEIL